MKNSCPLCNSSSKIFYQFKTRLYYQCDNCLGIFVDEKLRPKNTAEKLRYEEHNNDVEDTGYQNFVSPIPSEIMKNFTKENTGLDFGAGTAPVISKILTDNNYNIKQYDPFFYNYPELLNQKYDYIACCEVIEHFYNPNKEFQLLKNLLQENGKLYCMTDIYNEDIEFHKWYYKNDITHVFIYHEKTLHWIKNNFTFFNLTIEGRLITYTK